MLISIQFCGCVRLCAHDARYTFYVWLMHLARGGVVVVFLFALLNAQQSFIGDDLSR